MLKKRSKRECASTLTRGWCQALALPDLLATSDCGLLWGACRIGFSLHLIPKLESDGLARIDSVLPEEGGQVAGGLLASQSRFPPGVFEAKAWKGKKEKWVRSNVGPPAS